MLGIRLSARQLACFERYEQELLDWNARFNLTAIRESEAIRAKHFLDSLTCMLAWRDTPPASLIDVGTGAGFPGIPLKILQPSLESDSGRVGGKEGGILPPCFQDVRDGEGGRASGARRRDRPDAQIPRAALIGRWPGGCQPADPGRVPAAAGACGRVRAGPKGRERPGGSARKRAGHPPVGRTLAPVDQGGSARGG